MSMLNVREKNERGHQGCLAGVVKWECKLKVHALK